MEDVESTGQLKSNDKHDCQQPRYVRLVHHKLKVAEYLHVKYTVLLVLCVTVIEWNLIALLVKMSPLHYPSVAFRRQNTVSVVSPLQYQCQAIIPGTGMILKTTVKIS